MNVYGKGIGRAATVLLCAVIALGAGGCMRKKVVFVPPANLTPVALDVPPTDVLPLIDMPEVEPLPDPVAIAASRPRPRRRAIPRAIVPSTANAPTQVASVDGPPEDVASIGELTAGGDANPQRKQEAADLIASNDRRLKALSTRIVSGQRAQVSKIRNFQRQARLALDSGDADGAVTLATKARLLLHDLDGSSD